MIKLSEEQRCAATDVHNAITAGARILCLTGKAGTGKTTLLRYIGRDLEAKGMVVHYAAPTGKAAFRLSQLTGRKTTTLHGLLYGAVKEQIKTNKNVSWKKLKSYATDEEVKLVEEALKINERYVPSSIGWLDTRTMQTDLVAPTSHQPFHSPTSKSPPRLELIFGAPRHAINSDDVVIVDEASMVGVDLHEEILAQLPESATLLYVGDHRQLPPINKDWGPDFFCPTAALETIHRQAQDNPIIQIAAGILAGNALPFRSNHKYHRERTNVDGVSSWMTNHVKNQEDAIVLCYTRRVRHAVNNRVREMLGYKSDIVCGDLLKVAKNNKVLKRMNGEIVTVEDVTFSDLRGEMSLAIRGAMGRQSTVFCQPELIGKDQNEFNHYLRSNRIGPRLAQKYLHFDYGYALTVHSAQGSEFKKVAFVFDGSVHWLKRKDSEQARSLLYTATTRAIDHLTCFDLP